MTGALNSVRLLERLIMAHERGEHEGHADIICPRCPYVIPGWRW